VSVAEAAPLPFRPTRTDRIATLAVDPIVIAVVGLGVAGVVALLAGPSLVSAVLVGALVAGWSSAWSP
jgi:hypothetical protein